MLDPGPDVSLLQGTVGDELPDQRSTGSSIYNSFHLNLNLNLNSTSESRLPGAAVTGFSGISHAGMCMQDLLCSGHNDSDRSDQHYHYNRPLIGYDRAIEDKIMAAELPRKIAIKLKGRSRVGRATVSIYLTI